MKKNILFILIFILSLGNLFAQCESIPCPSNIPPTSIPWIPMAQTTVNVIFPNGIVCEYYVCYCWRDVGITDQIIEIYVKGGGPVDPNCPPVEYLLDGPLVLRLLGEAVMRQNPHGLNWPCPECGQMAIEYRLYYERCWFEGVPCAGGNSYCVGIYQVCCTAGMKFINKIGSSYLGDNCTYPCTGGCP